MERREPPPDDAEDPRLGRAAPAGPDRLALPGPTAPRPGGFAFDRSRSRMAIARLLVAVLAAYLASLGIRAAVIWLADQPAYQIPFREIRLDPPPPVWYRGGSEAFLQDVRRRAHMPDRISLLRLKEDELRVALQCNPWTEAVGTITYRPLGVTVQMDYHRPAALVEASSGHKYLLDRSATILPQDDLDVDVEVLVKQLGLMRITGDHLADPQDPQPGLRWESRAGVADLDPGNARIGAAARLAAFLVEKMRSIDLARAPGLHIESINPMDPHGRGLFLYNADKTIIILWGDAPSMVDSVDLEAEEKWAKLLEWSRSGKDLLLPTGDYWVVGSGGVYHQRISEQERAAYKQNAARIRRPKIDGSAIPAKDSGH